MARVKVSPSFEVRRFPAWSGRIPAGCQIRAGPSGWRMVETESRTRPEGRGSIDGASDAVAAAEGPPGSSDGRPADSEEELSLLELVNVLLKRWKLVVGLPVAAAFIAAVIALILPPKYRAVAVFLPETESGSVGLPSGLAGVAAQFGFNFGSGGADTPRFYADVMESRTLRDQILLARFPDPRGAAEGDSAPLIDILEIEGEELGKRLETGRRRLARIVGVAFNDETSVVSLGVKTRYRALSAAVANRYLELLNRFNLETRQSNARERRVFVEERMEEAQGELVAAEEELKTFLESNVQWRGSPRLEFEHDRLQRQVMIKQEVFTTLRRSYEEARIQEVNDTPVITVIDRAVPPQEKTSPRRRLMVMVSFFLGGVLGVFGAFGREFVERARQREEDEYAELAGHWASIKRELRRLRPRFARRRKET